MTLTKAILLATKAHDGQQDKGGSLYILHPLAVMLQMDTEDEMIVAVLHDVLEDTMLEMVDLEAAGFKPHILHALDLLTHKHGQTYDEYIAQVKTDTLATKIKLADLAENMRLDRLSMGSRVKEDLLRMAKYGRAVEVLSK